MAESSIKGVMEAETFRFNWTIKRFYADCDKVGDHYTSPAFPVHYSDNVTSWFLQVYPKGYDKESQDWISLFLFFQSENAFEVTAEYKCSIVSGQNREKFTCASLYNTFKGPAEKRGWENFVKQDVLKDTKNDALIDDTLTILCEISFSPFKDIDAERCYEYDEWQWQSKSYTSTIITYEELFESGSFVDVTFNIQESKIHLHKAILSCHSPVFKAMFEHDMKEKKESSVNIKDVDYEIMKELFRFIYSGKVENIKKIVKELLIAADKYSVANLKALCERTLYDSLTVDNAIEYLKVADMCDTLRLKKLMIKFVVDNLKEIVKKPNFKLMLADLNRDIVAELMEAMAETSRNFHLVSCCSKF